MKKYIVSIVLLSLLIFTACSGGAKEISDLSGTWVESGATGETTYQQATISGDVIEIVWVNAEEKSTMLYWAGTYMPPEKPVSEYTWDSMNDTSKTDSALFASGDDMKTFTYKDGVLSYSVTAMGITKTVDLKIKE